MLEARPQASIAPTIRRMAARPASIWPICSKRLGLYGELRPKMVLCKTGRECAMALVRGRAREIGITFTSEFISGRGHARGRARCRRRSST